MIYDTKKVHKAMLISKFKNMYTMLEIYRYM